MAIYAEHGDAVAGERARVDLADVGHDEVHLCQWSIRRLGAHHDLVALAGQRGLNPAGEHQIGHEDQYAGHRETARYRLRRRRKSWRTLSGRPHIWTTSARPSRTPLTTISPSIPS